MRCEAAMRQRFESSSIQRGVRVAEAFMLAAVIGVLVGGEITRRNARACTFAPAAQATGFAHFLCAGQSKFHGSAEP
jgi:FlaG/FlaF family flagellin (archaellin)